MFQSTSRLKMQLTAAVAVVALAVPATAPGYFDSGSSTPGNVDLRSPDAVDAARQVEAQQAQQAQIRPDSGPVDLRSPDAVDTRFVQTPEPATIVESGGGFDWGDGAIGAGAALGLLLIALSLMFTVVHHRNRAATV